MVGSDANFITIPDVLETKINLLIHVCASAFKTAIILVENHDSSIGSGFAPNKFVLRAPNAN